MSKEEIVNNIEEEVSEDSDGSSENSDDNSGRQVPIDLSENEIYRGVCTLLEDEDGNNILEYISLLHTELIGINKSLQNLKLIHKDIGRMADCAELFLKSQGHQLPEEQKEKRKQKK